MQKIRKSNGWLSRKSWTNGRTNEWTDRPDSLGHLRWIVPPCNFPEFPPPNATNTLNVPKLSLSLEVSRQKGIPEANCKFSSMKYKKSKVICSINCQNFSILTANVPFKPVPHQLWHFLSVPPIGVPPLGIENLLPLLGEGGGNWVPLFRKGRHYASATRLCC